MNATPVSIALFLSLILLSFTPALFSPNLGAEERNHIKHILVMGDSLSAEYGLKRGEGWVELLRTRLEKHQTTREDQLNRDHLKSEVHLHKVAQTHTPQQWKITNASISGETAAQGARKLPRRLKQAQPDWVIIELGANDALRGTPIKQIEKSLESMILHSKSAGAEVMLIGIRMPPNYGPRYTQQLTDLYAALAKKHNTLFVPFFLEGVATEPSLMQADRLHPTAKAQPIMLETVWHVLGPAL